MYCVYVGHVEAQWIFNLDFNTKSYVFHEANDSQIYFFILSFIFANKT